MTIAPYLRTIGRGKDGAKPLPFEQALALMTAILAGEVSDLELGGFALAMRIKGESAAELSAFMQAAQACTVAIAAPATAVLLPSYNGARKLPNFTPLLALLLAREGVPVLVHGVLQDTGRVTSAEVFCALGLPPCPDAAAVQAAWAAGQPAFMSLDTLNPALAKLLALRRVLGLRNSGHTMAKLLLPVRGAVRVVNHTHPEYAHSLTQYLQDTHADALLMRGTEGEPVADCRRHPRGDVFIRGVRSEVLSPPRQEGTLSELPALPEGIDAASTATHIRAVLAGTVPLPAPIAQQVITLRKLAAATVTRMP